MLLYASQVQRRSACPTHKCSIEIIDLNSHLHTWFKRAMYRILRVFIFQVCKNVFQVKDLVTYELELYLASKDTKPKITVL